MASPDVFRSQTGGGCLTWFGIPFWLIGVYALAQVLAGNESGPEPVVVGLVFTAVGCAMSFGRRGVIIDKRAGTVGRWWGVFWPLHTRYRPLDHFERVVLRSETRRDSDGDRYTVYPLELAGRATPLLVRSPLRYREARQLGEDIAKFLHIPMEDQRGGDYVVREPDQLDESVGDRARRLGHRVPLPSLEHETRIWPTHDDAGAQVTLPPPGMAAFPWLGLLVSLGAAAALWFLFLGEFIPETLDGLFRGKGAVIGPLIALAVELTLLLGPTLAVSVYGVLHVTTRARLSVDRQGVRLEQVNPFRRRGREVPAHEIEQIVVAPPELGWISIDRPARRVVSVRADDGFLEFGAHLSDLDREYLRDLMLHYLTG